jgi:hypothetical protein
MNSHNDRLKSKELPPPRPAAGRALLKISECGAPKKTRAGVKTCVPGLQHKMARWVALLCLLALVSADVQTHINIGFRPKDTTVAQNGLILSSFYHPAHFALNI